MDQALTCPRCGIATRLMRVEGDKGPFLRCSDVFGCDYRAPIPPDQLYRAAGLPTLFEALGG